MFEIDKFMIGGKSFQGVKSIMPGCPPLLLIKGVSSFDDVLNAQVKFATSKAKELGVEPGMIVKDVIAKLG
jgi:uncharacterized protein YunC (DUF1805 family)